MGKTILILVKKAPLLTQPQIKVIIDIGVVLGQLSLTSMVVPFAIPGFDTAKLPMIALGLLIAAGVWILSVLLARKIK